MRRQDGVRRCSRPTRESSDATAEAAPPPSPRALLRWGWSCALRLLRAIAPPFALRDAAFEHFSALDHPPPQPYQVSRQGDEITRKPSQRLGVEFTAR